MLNWCWMGFNGIFHDLSSTSIHSVCSVWDSCNTLFLVRRPPACHPSLNLGDTPCGILSRDVPTIARTARSHAVNWRRPENMLAANQVKLFWPWRLVKNHSTSHKICIEIHQKCCENAPTTMISPWKSAEILPDSSDDSPRSAHRCCWAVGRVSEQRGSGDSKEWIGTSYISIL